MHGGSFSYGVVFAATLNAVHALFGESVTDALQSTALSQLAADEVVDAVLGLVNGLDAADFGLVEGVYWGVRCQSAFLIDTFLYRDLDEYIPLAA
jgi:hypothetical protein